MFGKKKVNKNNNEMQNLCNSVVNLANRYIIIMQTLYQRNLIDKEVLDEVADEMQKVCNAAQEAGESQENLKAPSTIEEDINQKNKLIALRVAKLQIEQRIADWQKTLERFDKSKQEHGEEGILNLLDQNIKKGSKK